MREHAEHQAESRRQRTVERKHAVSAAAGEQRACLLPAERAARDAVPGSERAQAETRHRDRVPRRPQRSEDVGFEARPGIDEGTDKRAVSARVAVEARCRLVDRSPQQRAGAVVERMREARGRLDPFQPVRRERPFPKHP